MLLGVLLLLAVQTGGDSIDRLIQRLGDDSLEIRNQAEAALVKRARSWSESEVRKLKAAQEDPEAERASRARTALRLIDRYREVPDELWKAIPDLADRLVSADGAGIGEILDHVPPSKKSAFQPKTLIPFLIGLLDDERDSGVINYGWRSNGTLTVSGLACQRLAELVARFREKPTRQAAETWWKENRAKPEREWHLADLANPDEWVRASAGVNLAELKDEAAVPKLLEVLKGFDDTRAAAYVIGGFKNYPAAFRSKSLFPFLGDDRFRVRWAAARAILDSNPKEAVGAIVQALEKPSLLKEKPGGQTDLVETCAWLAKSNLQEARELLYRQTARGDGIARVAALLGLEGVRSPGCEEFLLEATCDFTTAWTWERGWTDARIKSPRACDVAALVLSRRLKIDDAGHWPDSMRDRNLQIERIINQWRQARNLDPIQYHGPGVIPVPAGAVNELIPDLTSTVESKRNAAVAKLCALGPGAWRTLLAAGERMPARALERFLDSQRKAANCLRSVAAEGPGIEGLAKPLRERLNKPITMEYLVQLIGDKWWNQREHGKLSCEIIRGADGEGFTISLSLEPADTSGLTPEGFDFEYENGSSWQRIDSNRTFLTAFEERLKPISAVMDHPELRARTRFTVEMTYPKNADDR